MRNTKTLASRLQIWAGVSGTLACTSLMLSTQPVSVAAQSSIAAQAGGAIGPQLSASPLVRAANGLVAGQLSSSLSSAALGLYFLSADDASTTDALNYSGDSGFNNLHLLSGPVACFDEVGDTTFATASSDAESGDTMYIAAASDNEGSDTTYTEASSDASGEEAELSASDEAGPTPYRHARAIRIGDPTRLD